MLLLAVMITVTLTVFGLIFGSFINALVWRLRKQDELAESNDDKVVISAKAEIQSAPLRFFSSFLRRQESSSENAKTSAFAGATKKNTGSTGRSAGDPKEKVSRQAQNDKGVEEDYSILHGRSMCPKCHHTLAARDLVPVFSWLILRGRCRYCNTPISWQYPLVELLTAFLFVLSYIFWPYGFDGVGWVQFTAWLVFLVGFVALTVYDIRWQELPDRIVWTLAGLAVVQTVFLAATKHDWRVLLWSVLGVAVISGLFWLLFEVSKGNWIGFGDVKLGIVLGLMAGTPLAAMLVIFFASVLGTLASLPMLMKTKQKMQLHVPFGPFLIAGLIIVYFFGDTIIHWYTSFLY